VRIILRFLPKRVSARFFLILIFLPVFFLVFLTGFWWSNRYNHIETVVNGPDVVFFTS
jgi:hypothetical protein